MQWIPVLGIKPLVGDRPMATGAQIEANRKDAQKSTGPRTKAGKAIARLNALKHGARARSVAPVPPQEDPGELDAKIRNRREKRRDRGGANEPNSGGGAR